MILDFFEVKFTLLSKPVDLITILFGPGGPQGCKVLSPASPALGYSFYLVPSAPSYVIPILFHSTTPNFFGGFLLPMKSFPSSTGNFRINVLALSEMFCNRFFCFGLFLFCNSMISFFLFFISFVM